MAALRASQNAAIRIQKHSLRSFLSHVRQLSSAGSGPNSEPTLFHEKGDIDDARTWPDVELKSLDPYDQMRFPLPGYSAPSQMSNSKTKEVAKPRLLSELLTSPTSLEKQADVITQFNAREAQMKGSISRKTDVHQVEIRVQDCPLLVRRDFQDLFPGSNVMSGDFSVISVCQQAENDMTSWSVEVESEREELVALFIETAKEVCDVLKGAGYWADFIDPSSGKPFQGPHTPATMFETDERYRHFGFQIEDLGCCKVIKHHAWGTRAFIGCIFTTASSTHPIMLEITGKVSD